MISLTKKYSVIASPPLNKYIVNRVIMIDQNMIGVFKTSKGMIMTIKMTLPYS